MDKREQYKRLLMFLASTFILLLQTGIFAYTWLVLYSKDGSNHFERGNYVIIAQYAVTMYFFYKVYGGYKVGYLRTFGVLYSQVLSVLCVNFITYLQLCLFARWKFGTNFAPLIPMTVADILAVILWTTFTRWVYASLYPPRKLLVVYGQYSPENLIRKLESREDKYAVQELVHISEDVAVIKEKILEYRTVILADIPAELRNLLLKYCFEQDVRCYSVPKISDIMIMGSSEIHLFDTALLLFRNRGLTIEQQIIKRTFDIVVSAVALVVASPIMLAIAVAIRLYDHGPVLFTQDRLTKGGKVFKIYKFRSMSLQPENSEYVLTRKNDDRITPVGNVIRKCHMDELPQLFNILKGDMSFVGPRPESPVLAEKYKQSIPEFDFRLKVKAGLTGYAQVYGKYNTTPYDKLKLDLAYIERYSFLLDLKLMMLTFKILFEKENTEGIESWQTSAATTTEEKEPVGSKR